MTTPISSLRAVARSVLITLLLAGGVAYAQSVAGTVKRVEGKPTIQSASGTRAAEVGTTVYVGDRVITGAGAAAGITLMDGTQLSVGPNSNTFVQNFQYDSTTRQGTLLVNVARGAMRMVSGLIAQNEPRNVSITTRTATIGIRGTDVLVDVGDSTDTQ